MASKKVSFEKALSELEEIVRELENGDLTLDDSLVSFKKGMSLSKICSDKLEEAEKKITILLEDKKGTVKEKQFDLLEEPNEL